MVCPEVRKTAGLRIITVKKTTMSFSDTSQWGVPLPISPLVTSEVIAPRSASQALIWDECDMSQSLGKRVAQSSNIRREPCDTYCQQTSRSALTRYWLMRTDASHFSKVAISCQAECSCHPALVCFSRQNETRIQKFSLFQANSCRYWKLILFITNSLGYLTHSKQCMGDSCKGRKAVARTGIANESVRVECDRWLYVDLSMKRLAKQKSCNCIRPCQYYRVQ